MGSRVLWDYTRKTLAVGLVGLVVSDRYANWVAVRGHSMSPTFNPSPNTFLGLSTDDRVLVTKFCLEKYRFTHGDIIAFRAPTNNKERHVKRIVALPGEWIRVSDSDDMMRIPNGHCWVEGDNPSISLDSRSFGPIPLGLIEGKATHVIWPPQRVGRVDQKVAQGKLVH
ncbi:hypothetical protein ACHQM5_007687 [Ranunculus cassubicifolius]